jgi:hypothetical protein
MKEGKKEGRKRGREGGREEGRVITEPNWAYLGETGDSEKTQDRQTDRKWSQVCWVLWWRCPTFIASFLYLYSLRPYSLQFFKTLLLKSSLKPCLKPLS